MPRLISMLSRKPRVTSIPTRLPRRSRTMFVATVEPCMKWLQLPRSSAEDSESCSAAVSSAARTPSLRSLGVDGTLLTQSAPFRSTRTMSVNVPPTSTPIRHGAVNADGSVDIDAMEARPRTCSAHSGGRRVDCTQDVSRRRDSLSSTIRASFHDARERADMDCAPRACNTLLPWITAAGRSAMRASATFFRCAALFGALVLAAPGLQAQERLSFAGYGGEPQKVQAKAFFEPAAKEFGIAVLQDSHGGYAKIKAQVLSGSPSYDLVALGCAEAARAAKEDILEPLDYSLIPNAADIDPR